MEISTTHPEPSSTESLVRTQVSESQLQQPSSWNPSEQLYSKIIAQQKDIPNDTYKDTQQYVQSATQVTTSKDETGISWSTEAVTSQDANAIEENADKTKQPQQVVQAISNSEDATKKTVVAKKKTDYAMSLTQPYRSARARSDKKRQSKSRQKDEHGSNYRFYKGLIKAKSLGIKIDQLLDWKGDYEKLEDCHCYIQWLFPNHYQSMFNSDSQPLSFSQAKRFRNDRDIGEKIYKAYEMYIDFIGAELQDRSGTLKLIDISRLKDALVHNTHNHLRLRRILACLSVVGFRQFALKLVEFLEDIIININVLQTQRLKSTFYSIWEIYGDKDLQVAKKNCQVQEAQIFKTVNPYLEEGDNHQSRVKGSEDF